METIAIRVDDIETGERHRALSADAVQRLAKSMGEIGLKQPISVRVVDEMEVEGEMVCGVPLLVAGAHRLAAAKALGWSHIDCIEIEDDPIAAELWEIAENLHRCDLTKDQRDQHIRRYAELLEARREVSLQNGTKPPAPTPQGGRPQGVAGQIAQETGLSKNTILRALKPQPKPVPVAPAPRDPEDAYNAWATALNRLWGSASMEWRERWLEDNDAPVFDSAQAYA